MGARPHAAPDQAFRHHRRQDDPAAPPGRRVPGHHAAERLTWAGACKRRCDAVVWGTGSRYHAPVPRLKPPVARRLLRPDRPELVQLVGQIVLFEPERELPHFLQTLTLL